MVDIIKFGLALAAGYFIADFLSPKGYATNSPKGNPNHIDRRGVGGSDSPIFYPKSTHYWPGAGGGNDVIPTAPHPHRDIDNPANQIDPNFIMGHSRLNRNQPEWQRPSGYPISITRDNRLTMAYQGYVFGQGHGNQRHQWDFMPHSLGPRRAYQGVLGVDYTLACSDQSVANGAGICANGTKAVVSPISQPPPPSPVISQPAPVLVPTSSDSGIPPPPPTPTTIPVATTPAPVAVPVVTTPTPVVATPTPVVTPLGPAPVDVIPHPSNNPTYWRQWAQDFRNDLRQDLQQHLRHGRENWGRNSGWSFQRSGHHAYQASSTTKQMVPARSDTSQTAVLLVTNTPTGLHLDAHGLQPSEPVTVDLNIPLSNVSRTTNLVADSNGHTTHDYNLTKPPGKQYIAAIRVTGQQSKRVGFKSVKI